MTDIDSGSLARSRRQVWLEYSLLGLLEQGSAHGYELRKRLIALYGPFRALSFSVLYPQLKRMLDAGYIEVSQTAVSSRRSKILYSITKNGKARLQELGAQVTPNDWDDENFEVRFPFFSITQKENRMAILQGRRDRLQLKANLIRNELKNSPKGSDTYLYEWRAHNLDSVEREIEWLEKLITAEKGGEGKS
jgi:DNA-binding PadR family transcriptional regulator